MEQMTRNWKIVNIRRYADGRGVYADLVDEAGDLYIEATLEYITERIGTMAIDGIEPRKSHRSWD